MVLSQSYCGLCLQDDFFWHLLPKRCELGKMPKFEASHELDMKRKRQAERGQHKQVWLTVTYIRHCALHAHRPASVWPADRP